MLASSHACGLSATIPGAKAIHIVMTFSKLLFAEQKFIYLPKIMNMSRCKYLLLLLLVLVSFSCRNRSPRDKANLYADSVIALQSDMIMQMDSFIQSSYYDDYEVSDFYLKAVNKNKESISKLGKLKYFRDNSDLYYASYNFYMTVDDVLKNEGPKVLNLKQKMNISFSQDLQDELNAVLLESAGKVTGSQLYFDSVLTVFLGEYGYDVEMDTNTVSSFGKDTLKNK
jgi:hypothetical protein